MRTEFREGDHIKILLCFLPGSNRRPCACEAHVITATLRKLHRRTTAIKGVDKNLQSSHLGIEPRTFGLEVQRAILCANGTGSRYR